MRTRIAIGVLLGALAFSPGLASAQGSSTALEQAIVEMADTPADHAALAKYYRAKAEEARAEASSHQAMGRSYGGGKMAQRQQMESHCKKIAEENTASAAEYEALAKLHEAEAKKTQ